MTNKIYFVILKEDNYLILFYLYTIGNLYNQHLKEFILHTLLCVHLYSRTFGINLRKIKNIIK